MPDCFISYSSEDSEIARKLKDMLENQGVSVFLAETSLNPGDDWSGKIKNNLRTSSWIFALMSESACQSGYVNQEVGLGILSEKSVIPVVWDMDPKKLPGWINQKEVIDLRERKFDSIKSEIEEIAGEIKANKRLGFLFFSSLIGLLWMLEE